MALYNRGSPGQHCLIHRQQRLEWNHGNRLSAVKNDAQTQTIESCLYDADGIRVKKVSGGATTYYPFPHYEVSNGVVTKYYFFNGQRVAMRQSGVLYYLHPEHLGGNLFATDAGGIKSSWQGYYAYGKTRWGTLQTDHRFTAPRGPPKYDATGLYYYNARYYDPAGALWARHVHLAGYTRARPHQHLGLQQVHVCAGQPNEV